MINHRRVQICISFAFILDFNILHRWDIRLIDIIAISNNTHSLLYFIIQINIEMTSIIIFISRSTNKFLKEMPNISRKQFTTLLGHSRRIIIISQNSNSIIKSLLSLNSQFTIAAILSSHVNNHRSLPHSIDSLLIYQSRSSFPRNQSSTNNNIHFLSLFQYHSPLSLIITSTHLPTITTSSSSILFIIHLYKLSTHRYNLLLNSLSTIKSSNNSP